MTIYYRDDFGGVAAKVDEQGVQFCGGKAYFTSGDVDMVVTIDAIMEITD